MINPDQPEKYRVTKLDGTPVDDAVVIRLKDPFAATALFTYCNTIVGAVELLADTVTPAEYERLLDIADYFHDKAIESAQIKNKRLPD